MSRTRPSSSSPRRRRRPRAGGRRQGAGAGAARPAAAMPPPRRYRSHQTAPRARAPSGSCRDKVRNTTLAFKSPKLGFTLGLAEGQLDPRAARRHDVPPFLASRRATRCSRRRRQVPVPFPRDDFAGLLRKLSAAPRPLELTFVRVRRRAGAARDVARVRVGGGPAGAGRRRGRAAAHLRAGAGARRRAGTARRTAAAAAITTEAAAPEPPAPAAVPLVFRTSGSPSTVQNSEVAARGARHELDKKADGGEPDAAAGPPSTRAPRPRPRRRRPRPGVLMKTRAASSAGGGHPARGHPGKAAEKADGATPRPSRRSRPPTTLAGGEQDTP